MKANRMRSNLKAGHRCQWVILLLALSAAFSAEAFYNPSTGRWINRDPLGESAFETRRGERADTFGGGPNLYTYVGNEPVRGIDVLGLVRGDDFWEPPQLKPQPLPPCVKECAKKCALAHLPMRGVCILGCAGGGPGYLACVVPCMAAVTLSQAICTAACIAGSQ